jgi:Concanavalin A-like lectin/glucanases superfamily
MYLKRLLIIIFLVAFPVIVYAGMLLGVIAMGTVTGGGAPTSGGLLSISISNGGGQTITDISSTYCNDDGDPDSCCTGPGTSDGTPPCVTTSGISYSPGLLSLTTGSGTVQVLAVDGTGMITSATVSAAGNYDYTTGTTVNASTSPASFVVTAVTPSVPPSVPVIATSPTYTSITISLVSGDVGTTSNNLRWGLSTGNTNTPIVGLTLPYVHSGLTGSTNYFYKLVALNSFGTTTGSEVKGTTIKSDYYNQVIGTSGLGAYWRFDGNWNDLKSGNTLSSIGSSATNTATGRFGTYAASFNTTTTGYSPAYASRAGSVSGIGGSSTFSMEAWVTRATLSTYQIILSSGNDSADYNHFIRFNSDNTILAYVAQTNNDFYQLQTSATFTLTSSLTCTNTCNWYHIVATWNFNGSRGASLGHLYVNNIDQSVTKGYVANQSTGAANTLTDYMTIGAVYSSSSSTYHSGYSGLIDEVAIYNSVLSAATVSAHYNSTY